MRSFITVLTVLLVLTGLSVAQAPRFGVGVFAGVDIPIVQDDQDNGSIFGIRGRIKLLPMITVEPRIHFTKYGDPSFDEFTADLEGSKVTAFGVDGLIGAPFSPFGVYGIFGLGSYKIKRDQTNQDESEFGWQAGIGFELGLTPQFAADARGLLIVIPSDGGGSKKSAAIFAGLNFHFGQ